MPIEFGIWRVAGEKTTPVKTSALENEARLEAILEQDPTILGLDVLLIVGRQVITTLGTRIDLLAIDSCWSTLARWKARIDRATSLFPDFQPGIADG